MKRFTNIVRDVAGMAIVMTASLLALATALAIWLLPYALAVLLLMVVFG